MDYGAETGDLVTVCILDNWACNRYSNILLASPV